MSTRRLGSPTFWRDCQIIRRRGSKNCCHGIGKSGSWLSARSPPLSPLDRQNGDIGDYPRRRSDAYDCFDALCFSDDRESGPRPHESPHFCMTPKSLNF
jgi:hypothetical protein